MELKLIRGTSNIGKELLEVSTKESKIIIGFGEELSTGEIAETINPIIDGLTDGTPEYDGVFILRNPENSNLVEYTLEEIPIYMETKIKNCYEICADFGKCKKRKNVLEIVKQTPINIKDMQITYFLLDPSNQNTSMILIKAEGKSVLVSGDFRDHSPNFAKDLLDIYMSQIGRVDYWFIEGKYFEKKGLNNVFADEYSKLKNIMKFYKQVFIFQSETDLATTTKMFEAAQRTKKIFIENTFLANLTSLTNGSAPNPITTKGVYTYSPLTLENKDFEFKKKYVAHFYIHSANTKMKKEKFVMNINTSMLQDIQLFDKQQIIYDACIIFAMNKKFLQNKRLEEFINILREFQIDYYELYTVKRVNFDFLNKIMLKCKPNNVIPIGFDPEHNDGTRMHKFKYLPENEILSI